MHGNLLQTLLTGLGLVESPRWHGDRLYFSDWTAGEVVAVDSPAGARWSRGWRRCRCAPTGCPTAGC